MSRRRSLKWQIDIISREATDKDNILMSELPRKFLSPRYYRCYNEINTAVLYWLKGQCNWPPMYDNIRWATCNKEAL